MLNDSMTNTGTISNSTSTTNRNNNKVNRSLTANLLKSTKEVDEDSKSRMHGHGNNNIKKVASTEDGGAVEGEQQTPRQQQSTGRQLMMEDSSSSHSTAPLDSFDVMDKHPHPLAPVKVVHRPQHQRQQQQVENPTMWGKHIEEGIHGIMKRLDQLTIARENNLSDPPNTKSNGLIAPINGRRTHVVPTNIHRDIITERMHYAKERERMAQRIEELQRQAEKLDNEIRQWKTRHDDLLTENRHLKLVKFPVVDELKSRPSAVMLTDLKGRPSVVMSDHPSNKRGESGWLSLWNVLPHVGPIVPTIGPEPSNFSSSHSDNLLRCLQINLQHKKKAMERVKRLIVDRNIDIALIQEPYAVGTATPELFGVPTGYTGYHYLTEHHPYGAAIIAKNSLRAKSSSFGRNDIAGIHLRSANKTYHFYSVFCRPSSINLGSTLLPLLDQAPPTVVIGMDASAKHPKYNNSMVYRKIDQRGRELERLLDQYDMHLASPPLYKLKYIPENYSFIDVTLGGENIAFHDWKFWEDSLSDHPYIFFQVE